MYVSSLSFSLVYPAACFLFCLIVAAQQLELPIAVTHLLFLELTFPYFSLSSLLRLRRLLQVCGSTKKVHSIFNYAGSNLDHSKNVMCETDQLTHLYTLIVNNADNTYEVRVDGEKKESGSALADWPFLKPKQINDPAVSKPTDWVDTTEVDDPADAKPAGWDEIPAQTADPEASKPEVSYWFLLLLLASPFYFQHTLSALPFLTHKNTFSFPPQDWDDEDDGEWEAPMIDNPEYKGEWKAKKIPNPDYKGSWVHPQVDNPDFVDEKAPTKYATMDYIGFDLWQVKSGDIFDNIIVTDSVEEADTFSKATFFKNKDAEKVMFDRAEEAEKATAAAAAAAKQAADKAAEEAEAKDDEEDEEEDKEEDSI